METVRNCLPPRKTCVRCNETIVLVQKTLTRGKENKFNLTYVTFTIQVKRMQLLQRRQLARKELKKSLWPFNGRCVLVLLFKRAVFIFCDEV